MAMIDIEHVTMRYRLGIDRNYSLKRMFMDLVRHKKMGQKEYLNALDDVTLHVEKGEVVGLVGANGAGKSTLLKVVSGVMKPTKGTVTTGGSISPMIELGAGFDMELTARENIYLNGAILGYSEQFLNDRFDEIVDFSEVRGFLDEPLQNFSSGMVTKLAFSIATVVDPEILIVDEILAVGDLAFQQKSKNKMIGMITGGTTVLYVSHDLESIRELCTRVVWLDHGRIVEQGDPQAVCDDYYRFEMKEN